MKLILGTLIVAASIFAYSCGKKDSSSSSSTEETGDAAVASLSLTCGGKTCIGTEGK